MKDYKPVITSIREARRFKTHIALLYCALLLLILVAGDWLGRVL